MLSRGNFLGFGVGIFVGRAVAWVVGMQRWGLRCCLEAAGEWVVGGIEREFQRCWHSLEVFFSFCFLVEQYARVKAK